MSVKSHEHRRQIKATKPGAFHKRRPAGTKVLRAALMGKTACSAPPFGAAQMTREQADRFIDKRRNVARSRPAPKRVKFRAGGPRSRLPGR